MQHRRFIRQKTPGGHKSETFPIPINAAVQDVSADPGTELLFDAKVEK